jgi:hypothetical protein
VRYTQRDRIVAQPLPPALTLPVRSQIGHVLRWLSLSSLPSTRALGTRSGSRLGAGAPCLPVSSRRTLGPFSWSICPGRGTASAPAGWATVARATIRVYRCWRSCCGTIRLAPRGTATKLTPGCFQLARMQTGADGSLGRKGWRIACARSAFVISRSEVRILSPAPPDR